MKGAFDLNEKFSVNKFVKILVITGFSIVVLTLLSSFLIQIIALRSKDYYLLNEISIELIKTSGKCAATTSLGSFLISLTY